MWVTTIGACTTTFVSSHRSAEIVRCRTHASSYNTVDAYFKPPTPPRDMFSPEVHDAVRRQWESWNTEHHVSLRRSTTISMHPFSRSSSATSVNEILDDISRVTLILAAQWNNDDDVDGCNINTTADENKKCETSSNFSTCLSNPLVMARALKRLSLALGLPVDTASACAQMEPELLKLPASHLTRVMLVLRETNPRVDAAHMVALEPALLLLPPDELALVAADALEALRLIFPEPCVALLIQEEPALLLSRGGIARLDVLRETAEAQAPNLAQLQLTRDGWLDVDAQRWFVNVFVEY